MPAASSGGEHAGQSRAASAKRNLSADNDISRDFVCAEPQHFRSPPSPAVHTLNRIPSFHRIFFLALILTGIMVSGLLRIPIRPLRHRPQNVLTTYLQAHRIITQVVFTSTRIFGRAFAEAWRQAAASQKNAAFQNQTSPGSATRSYAQGISLDEACKILNVAPPKGGKADMEQVMERFKKLYDQNEPKKGGSFYLQSKILRARERIESEVHSTEEAASREQEMKEGWKPKVYKDR